MVDSAIPIYLGTLELEEMNSEFVNTPRWQ
jgi:hypothetical protein